MVRDTIEMKSRKYRIIVTIPVAAAD